MKCMPMTKDYSTSFNPTYDGYESRNVGMEYLTPVLGHSVNLIIEACVDRWHFETGIPLQQLRDHRGILHQPPSFSMKALPLRGDLQYSLSISEPTWEQSGLQCQILLLYTKTIRMHTEYFQKLCLCIFSSHTSVHFKSANLFSVQFDDVWFFQGVVM